MDSSVFEDSLKVYFEAFAEEAISETIEGFHARMPGARLVLASGLNTLLNIARFKVAIVNADGSTRAVGDNVIEMAEEGRIHRVFPFWEPVPPVAESWPRHLAL